jgi:hypothetical protein
MSSREQPERLPGESPVEFYERTRWCPSDYTSRHKGRYYCNPAHCSSSWRNKAERDKHLAGAYALLD